MEGNEKGWVSDELWQEVKDKQYKQIGDRS